MTKITLDRAVVQQALEALKSAPNAVVEVAEGRWELKSDLAITALCAALAEPTVKESLQVESAFAENATTQQQLEEAPPSDYRRGYWDGFEIGKREGRIEAENALAEPQEPDSPERRCGGPGCDLKCCQAVEEPDDKAASIRWQLCLLAQTEEFSDDVRNQIGRGVWLIDRLRAALAEPVQEPDLSRCPKCNGPADNGHDREVPPNPYYCTKCMAEPVQEPVHGIGGEG